MWNGPFGYWLHRALYASRTRLHARRPLVRGTTPLALLGAAALVVRTRYSFQAARASIPVSVACSSTGESKRKAHFTAVLVRNGQADTPWITKDKLLKYFSGAYTTARTVNRAAIFEFSMHCSRLHSTATAVLKRERETSSCATRSEALEFLGKAGPDGLKPLVQSEVVTAIEQLKAAGIESGQDFQVTLLFTCDTVGQHTPVGRGFDIFTFVQPLPDIEAMVDVQARTAERSNPTIKDVQWVNDRQYLEEVQRKAGVNEVLMFDSKGMVTEGLQTNFFAISKDGTLLTAPDERVLAGTVRKVVLQVAEQNNIPVKFQCPSINDWNTWESCFICSTSRLVKPIRSITIPSLSASRPFPLQDSLSHRIEELVKDAVLANSEPL